MKRDINELVFNQNKYQLYQVLKKALLNTKYYTGKYNLPIYEEFDYKYFFDNVPYLEKRNLVNNEDIINKHIAHSDLDVEVTSGSSGIPIKCYKSKNERLQYGINLWKIRKSILKGLSPNDKMVHFFIRKYVNGKKIDKGSYIEDNILHLSSMDLTDNILIEYWYKIISFKPRWLHGLPSIVMRLALIVEKYNLPQLTIEFVELTGEFIKDEQIKKIKEVFNCVIGNQYGCREFWLIGYGTNSNNLLVNSENVFLEIVENEIVVTSLKNNTWPLIRYKLGDLAKYESYKESKLYIKLIEGRKSEVCELNGKILGKVLFSYIIKEINNQIYPKKIMQYQIIRENSYSLTVKFVSDCSVQDISDRFKELLLQYVDPVEINFKKVTQIKNSNKTGKLYEFINKEINNVR